MLQTAATGAGANGSGAPRLAPKPVQVLGVGLDTGENAGVLAELERLRAENARLKAMSETRLSFKVSKANAEKGTKGGALSVYGLGRFPVTLYKEQWLRLLDVADDIRGFIRENAGVLLSKADKLAHE